MRKEAIGQALAENLADNPICSIRVDESVPCATVRWKGYATSSRLRYVLKLLIELLRSHGLTRILGEDTALPTILAEDQRRIAEDWVPRAAAVGLVAIASARPASYFGQVAVESVLRIIAMGVSVRLFDNVEEARAWLWSFGATLNPQPAT